MDSHDARRLVALCGVWAVAAGCGNSANDLDGLDGLGGGLASGGLDGPSVSDTDLGSSSGGDATGGDGGVGGGGSGSGTTSAGATSSDSSGSAPECSGPSIYATEVVSFEPGLNAGFGRAELPDVVLGPPQIGPPGSGSLDVLSLGVGGEIVLAFDGVIVDRPGPDFVVWENVFWVNGDPDNPFAELGEVAVSVDGEVWQTFSCDPDLEGGFDANCVGWRPRRQFDPCEVPLNPDVSGGDPFDLEELGIDRVRFVRIRDLAESGTPPSAGMDLDAVGAVHLQ